jgi:hypothetical protein
MIPQPHHDHGTLLDTASVALVAHPDDSLQLLVPQDWDADMSRSQVFIAAVAFRSTDPEWVGEMLEFIAEVRRELGSR